MKRNNPPSNSIVRSRSLFKSLVECNSEGEKFTAAPRFTSRLVGRGKKATV